MVLLYLPFPVLGSLAVFLGLQATLLPVPGTVLGGVSADVARFFWISFLAFCDITSGWVFCPVLLRTAVKEVNKSFKIDIRYKKAQLNVYQMQLSILHHKQMHFTCVV